MNSGGTLSRSVLRISVVLFSLLSSLSQAADKNWVQGIVVSIDITTIPVTPKRISHRYQCVISDGTYSYTVEYDKPLRAAIRDPIKLSVGPDRIVLLDADGKERSAKIEKRERLDSSSK